MARKRLDERNERKLQRTSGGSYRLTIPISIIRELKWRDNQKVIVERDGSRIIIKDWK